MTEIDKYYLPWELVYGQLSSFHFTQRVSIRRKLDGVNIRICIDYDYETKHYYAKVPYLQGKYENLSHAQRDCDTWLLQYGYKLIPEDQVERYRSKLILL